MFGFIKIDVCSLFNSTLTNNLRLFDIIYEWLRIECERREIVSAEVQLEIASA